MTFLSGASDESLINVYMQLNEYSDIVPNKFFSKKKNFQIHIFFAQFHIWILTNVLSGIHLYVVRHIN